jgi:transposase
LDNILDEIENDSVIYLEKSFNKFLKEQSKRLLIKAEKEGKDYNLDEIMNMITFDLENIINESYEGIIDETCKNVSKKHFNKFVKSNNEIIMSEITKKAIKIEMVKNTKESIKAEIGSIKDKTVETLLKNILTKLSEKSLNINDLDAKWMPINNTPILTNNNNMAHGYNCCFLAESNGYILSTYASQSPNDASSLKPVIDQYQTFFKTNNEPQINNEKEKLVVDNGYNNLNNLKFCEKSDIDLYTPTKKEAIITNKKYKHETIKIDSPLIFQKDPEIKWLKCNQKKKLMLITEKRLALAYNEIEQQTEYEYHTTECKNCPDKKECNKNQDEKTVKITITDTELKHEEKMKTEEAKEIYKKRKYKIEPIFGHSKHNKKFTHLITTKVENIGTVLKTFAATINLTKIHKSITLTNKTEKSPRKIYQIFKSKQSTMDQYMVA